MSSGNLFAGLMSGTSIDGIDAVVVQIDGQSREEVEWSLRAFRTTMYDEHRRRTILDAVEEGTPEALCRLDASLGEWLASAVLDVCEIAGVEAGGLAAIGSHGQTVWHIPPTDAERGATLQLGDAATLAERTGASVVSDFRSRDVAAGGQGAPLVPWLDQLLFSALDRRRAIQNLGGMANVTWLPPTGSPEPVIAFDTGPGVALIDGAVRRATGGASPFDRDGLEPGRDEDAWCDLVATLTALTARSIVEAYRAWVLPGGLDEVFVVGGGANNPALVQAIEQGLDGIRVTSGAELGVDPDAREALAFAFLAWAHLHGIAGNIPSVTGAEAPRVLGSLTPSSAASEAEA